MGEESGGSGCTAPNLAGPRRGSTPSHPVPELSGNTRVSSGTRGERVPRTAKADGSSKGVLGGQGHAQGRWLEPCRTTARAKPVRFCSYSHAPALLGRR